MKKLSHKLSVIQTSYQYLRARQEFFRNQQWRVIYYSILLYGAIYVISTNVKNCYLFFILLLSGIVICIICDYIILNLKESMKETRGNLSNIESVIPLFIAATSNKPREDLLKCINLESVFCTCVKSNDRSVQYPKGRQGENIISNLLVFINSFAYLILAIILIHRYCSYLRITNC